VVEHGEHGTRLVGRVPESLAADLAALAGPGVAGDAAG
jgi:hypothetical protein